MSVARRARSLDKKLATLMARYRKALRALEVDDPQPDFFIPAWARWCDRQLKKAEKVTRCQERVWSFVRENY